MCADIFIEAGNITYTIFPSQEILMQQGNPVDTINSLPSESEEQFKQRVKEYVEQERILLLQLC